MKDHLTYTCQNGSNQRCKKQQVLVRLQTKGNPLILLVGLPTGTATLENSMEVPQKVKNRTTPQSSSCITRYLPKEYKNTNSRGYMHPDIYSSIIYKSQIMETTQVSITWMDKEGVVYIGALGWLSRLRIQLWLRSWSHGSWVRAPHQALCCQHGAPLASSVPLSLGASPTCTLSQNK